MHLSAASITPVSSRSPPGTRLILVQRLSEEMLPGDHLSTHNFLVKLVFRDSALLICDKKWLDCLIT